MLMITKATSVTLAGTSAGCVSPDQCLYLDPLALVYAYTCNACTH